MGLVPHWPIAQCRYTDHTNWLKIWRPTFIKL